MVKVGVCKDRDAASALLHKGTVDVALAEVPLKDVTYVYWLLKDSLRDSIMLAIENLPGYRFDSMSGYPAPQLVTGHCDQKVSEVLRILSEENPASRTGTGAR